jgi:restriction system protein
MEWLSTLQWLLPALLLVGTAALVLKHRRRTSVHERVLADGTRRSLAQISWPEVEKLVAEYFRRREFAVTESRRTGPDGGIDLELTKRGEYYLVQCKLWRALSVDVETIREFHRVMAARHAVGGFVVTSGSFTTEARKFAEGREIELIDGGQLTSRINLSDR